MNCLSTSEYTNPHNAHIALPLRYAELRTVYRAELSGTLHGLTRVKVHSGRAHIFCTPESVRAEILGCLDLRFLFGVFGFKDIKVELSVRGDDRTLIILVPTTNGIRRNASGRCLEPEEGISPADRR